MAFDPKSCSTSIATLHRHIARGTSSPIPGSDRRLHRTLGSWVKVLIDADKDNNAAFNNSADYPGPGVDDTNIYINANMFSTS